jgi:hypothetical protein
LAELFSRKTTEFLEEPGRIMLSKNNDASYLQTFAVDELK